MKVIVGHFVATDGEQPDNLGVLDASVSAVEYESDYQLMWWPDGIVVEVAAGPGEQAPSYNEIAEEAERESREQGYRFNAGAGEETT